MKRAHEQVCLNLHGSRIEVDKGVQELILLLNNFQGSETYNSCEGDQGQAGYVQFGGDGALAALPYLAAAILRQEKLWRRNHRHVCRGCRSMSISLEVCGSGICLRWSSWDYLRVVRIIRLMVSSRV